MNGSLNSLDGAVRIHLKRGPAGLGFNIVGGVDQPYVQNDCGIFVSKIKEDGAAAMDGRLEEGDKIIMINGISVEAKEHRHVVDIFRSAGEDVELWVQKKSLMSRDVPRSDPSDPSFLQIAVVVLLIAGACALFTTYRRVRASH